MASRGITAWRIKSLQHCVTTSAMYRFTKGCAGSWFVLVVSLVNWGLLKIVEQHQSVNCSKTSMMVTKTYGIQQKLEKLELNAWIDPLICAWEDVDYKTWRRHCSGCLDQKHSVWLTEIQKCVCLWDVSTLGKLEKQRSLVSYLPRSSSSSWTDGQIKRWQGEWPFWFFF